MPRSDQQIDLLWATVFGQPPPITAAPDLLLAVLVEHLPLAPPYGPSFVAMDEPTAEGIGQVEPVAEPSETDAAAALARAIVR